MDFIFRKAKISDIGNLERLITKSARSVNSAFYSKIEIDAALGKAWAVDRQLIIDNTYWIVENAEGVVVGCGGWSMRKLLFGKNDVLNSLNNELIPGIDSARIRAFFVHPDFTRMGIGKRLLKDVKDSKELVEKGKELIKKIDEWEASLIETRQKNFQDVINFSSKLNVEFLYLKNLADAHDPRITEGLKSRNADLDKEWVKYRNIYDKDLRKTIDNYNALFKNKNLPAIIWELGVQ